MINIIKVIDLDKLNNKITQASSIGTVKYLIMNEITMRMLSSAYPEKIYQTPKAAGTLSKFKGMSIAICSGLADGEVDIK